MEVPFPQKLARLDQERLRAYRENLEFYQGIQWPGPSRRRERRLTFNYARILVDKLTSYLMSGLTIAVEPSDLSPAAVERARRAAEVLLEVREQNNLEQLDFDTETDCAILGDGCYKIMWDGTGARVTAPDVQAVLCTVGTGIPTEISTWRRSGQTLTLASSIFSTQ